MDPSPRSLGGILQRPTTGRLRVKGRVAPLLELGASFDFEPTGRKNVFLNGTILGFREVDVAHRFDRIADFAEIRDFIDLPSGPTRRAWWPGWASPSPPTCNPT